MDLSGHGVRKAEPAPLTPWEAEPDLRAAATYAARHWETVSVRANSIGAYFALLFLDEPARALLVSPVLDMERLILDRMKAQGVSEEQLQARGEIPSEWGGCTFLAVSVLCAGTSHPPLALSDLPFVCRAGYRGFSRDCGCVCPEPCRQPYGYGGRRTLVSHARSAVVSAVVGTGELLRRGGRRRLKALRGRKNFRWP